MSITYPSIEAFYADRGGELRPELDFGVWWTGERHFPRYRVSVVHYTGDLYVLDLYSKTVELLATLPHSCEMPARVLDHCESCCYELAKRLLTGWTDHIHEPNSLQWVREALAEVRAS